MLIADVDGRSGQSAAVDLPRVVLLGEDCADEPPDRSPVREDAHHAGASPYLLGEALLGVVRSDLLPVGQGEGGEGEEIRAHVGQQFGGLGEAFVEHAHHARMLCVVLRWATVGGMATLGGAQRFHSRCLAAEARCSGRSRGALVQWPFRVAKRALWPSSRKMECGVGVDWGIDQTQL